MLLACFDRSRRTPGGVLLVLLLGVASPPSPVRSATEVLLTDGQRLQAEDVKRDGNQYLVHLKGGGILALPQELVEGIALSGAPAQETPTNRAETGFVNAAPRTLAGNSALAMGVKTSDPQVLAGVQVRPPTPSEQTAAIGAPSKFQKGISDPYWHPKSAFTADHTQFNPADWSPDIVDHSWTPTSDYTKDTDVTKVDESSFQKGVIDPEWRPQNAFQKPAWPGS